MKKGIFYLTVFISAFGVICVILYLYIAVYVEGYSNKDTKMKSDAIVVLGAKSYVDGKYNSCLVARVDHAAELYKAKYASKILVSGGNDMEDNVNEAETMKNIAEKEGVPAKAILLEKASTSTYENFVNSQKILSQNHLKTVIIVTEPFHMARASLVASKLGYVYTVSPAEKSPCWDSNKYFTKYFLKEPLAIMRYRIEGKL